MKEPQDNTHHTKVLVTGGLGKTYADATLVRQTLGRKPQFTLKDIMRDAWNWQKRL